MCLIFIICLALSSQVFLLEVCLLACVHVCLFITGCHIAQVGLKLTHYVAKASLKLLFLLSPLKCWNHWLMSLCLASSFFWVTKTFPVGSFSARCTPSVPL